MLHIKESGNIELSYAYKTVFDDYFSLIFDIIEDSQVQKHMDDIIRIYHLEDSIKQ
jgi:hypothetical protein